MFLGESTLEDKLYYRGRPSQPKMSQLGSERKWSQAEKHELRSERRHCGALGSLPAHFTDGAIEAEGNSLHGITF